MEGYPLPRRHEAIAQLYRSNVEAFVDFAFRELNPGHKLTWHWYLDVIVDRVDAVLKGKCKRLVINAPPRTLKTLIATLALIAMYVGRHPEKQVLLITGHPPLTSDLMKRLRRLMDSERYRSVFQNLRLRFAGTTIQTSHGGGLRSATVGQQLSGHGADLVVIDDPLSAHRASYGKACKEVNDWFDAEVLQRLNNRARGAMVLVMQRVASGDLSSHVMSQIENIEGVILPSISTSDEQWELSNGRCLRRRPGQLLDPFDSPEQQFALMERVGAYIYATQYLQDTCGSSDGPMMMRWEPKGADWTPESSRRGGFYRITYRQRIMHKAFGHPMPEYADWGYECDLTDEEWEAQAAVIQRRIPALGSH